MQNPQTDQSASQPEPSQAIPQSAPAQTEEQVNGAMSVEEKPAEVLITESELQVILKKAHDFLNINNVDEALLTLEEGLKKGEAAFGESSYEAARFHFEIGSALLQKVESSRDVFGGALKKEDKDAKENSQEEAEEPVEETDQQVETNLETVPEETSVEQTGGESQGQPSSTTKLLEITDKKDLVEISEEQDSKETAITSEQDQTGQIEEKQDEEVEDLQVAWEQMEVARVNLEKLAEAHDLSNPDLDEETIKKQTKVLKALGLVRLRLGDANCFREDFEASLQDYEKCLELRKITEDAFFSRDLSEIYYLIGNAHVYRNLEKSDDIAINFFNKARIIIENLLYKEMHSSSVKDPEDLQAHQTFMGQQFLKSSPFETEKIKELKDIAIELYNKIEDTKLQKAERTKVEEELKRAKMMTEMAASAQSSFAKPTLTTQQAADANGQPKPAPKVIHLGTLGSARRRTREEMEKGSTNNQPNGLKLMNQPQTTSQNQAANQSLNAKSTQAVSGDQITNENQNTEAANVSGKITKVNDDGHIEKMAKI